MRASGSGTGSPVAIIVPVPTMSFAEPDVLVRVSKRSDCLYSTNHPDYGKVKSVSPRVVTIHAAGVSLLSVTSSHHAPTPSNVCGREQLCVAWWRKYFWDV